MKFKVHWIIDGIAEIEGESKEDAEKKLQESLEEYVKNSDDLMNKFIAKSIQGTAYLEGEKDNEKQDELYKTALEIVKSEGKASTSFLQRKLQIGYNRAARIIDMMEINGEVSKANHVGKREVLK